MRRVLLKVLLWILAFLSIAAVAIASHFLFPGSLIAFISRSPSATLQDMAIGLESLVWGVCAALFIVAWLERRFAPAGEAEQSQALILQYRAAGLFGGGLLAVLVGIQFLVLGSPVAGALHLLGGVLAVWRGFRRRRDWVA